MNWKKILKVLGIVLGSMLLLVIIGNIVINQIIKHQLPKIIEERNDTAYHISYEDLGFSLANSSIWIKNAKVLPKQGVDIEKEIDFQGTVGKVSVVGVNFIELLRKKNLKAFTIYIDEPDLTLYQQEKDTTPGKSQFLKYVDIDKITVRKANFRRVTVQGDSLLQRAYNFNAEIEGIHMGVYTEGKDIPFTYTDYKFSFDSIYTKLNDFQYATTKKIDITKDHIEVKEFRLFPNLSSEEFKKRATQSNTRLDLEVPELQLRNTDWGYNKDNEFYVKVGKIDIDSIRFNILDQKHQTVFQEAKKSSEKFIQPLIPFPIDIDEINIKRSSFKSLGILDVQNVNIQIKNISNRLREHLIIDELNLNQPKFVHIPLKNSEVNRKQSEPSQLNDVIIIKKANINDAHYELKDKNAQYNQLVVNKFNLTLSDVRVDDQSVGEMIPFTFKNPKLQSGRIHYNTGVNYDIYSNGIQIENDKVVIQNLEMKPKKSRQAFNKSIKYATDHYTITTGKLEFDKMDFGFDATETFYIKFKEAALHNIDANIYRNVGKPDDGVISEMYSRKLRQMKIGLDVGKVRVVNSKLEYEEEGSGSNAPGKLTFTNVNANIQNVYSGHGRTSGPKTIVDVKTVFMKESQLSANWTFNIMNKAEAFNINGVIRNFDAKAMNPFIKPYIHVSTEGTIDKMQFNFTGNNNTAKGDFGIQFQNLKVTLHNKESGEERKFLTKVGNWFVRDDTKGKLKSVETKEVARDKTSSFWNFLWLNVMQGLKQTIL